MRTLLAALLAFSLFAGCASTRAPEETAQDQTPKNHSGKVVGGAGGALAGGAMAYSSAGLMCTIGGPLCAVVVIPAAVIGGVLGLAAGSVVDAARDAKAPPREDPNR